MSRIRKIATALLVGALMTIAVPSAAQAGKPSNGCPPGFGLGAMTADQIVQLPRSQAAIAAGVVDEARIRAGVASVDKNGTGSVCAKVSYGLLTSNKPNGQYLINLVDDNSSVR